MHRQKDSLPLPLACNLGKSCPTSFKSCRESRMTRRLMKRPAAAKPAAKPVAKPAAKQRPEQHVAVAPADGKNFKLKRFLGDIWRRGGYELTEKTHWKVLKLATSCSGAGTVVHVLQAALGAEWVHELFAVEREPAAVAFLMRNYSPDCIFQDRDCSLECNMTVHSDIRRQATLPEEAVRPA